MKFESPKVRSKKKFIKQSTAAGGGGKLTNLQFKMK